MSIHRLAKYQTDDPFTRIPNTAIRDDRLDLKALGLLVVMLSKPDGWRFTERNLAVECGVGRAQIRTAIAALLDAGYVRRHHEAGEDGRPIMVTEVYDTPQPQGPETGPTPGYGNPTVGDPQGPETEPPINNGVLVTNESEVTNEQRVEVPTTKVAGEGWDTARDLCDHLVKAILESGGPGTKPPTVTRKWIETMEKLVRLDGREPDQVRAAIDWCHRGPGQWWSDKVLSPDALRRHYEKLRRQAARNGNGHRAPNGRTGDQLRAAAAAMREAGR